MATTEPLSVITRKDSVNSFSEHILGVMASLAKGKERPSNSLELTVLGVCAGASLSHVGCSLVRYRQDSTELLHMAFIRYDEINVSPEVRSPILTLLRDRRMNPHAMLRVHVMLGHMLATSVNDFFGKHNIVPASVNLISLQADSIPASVLPSTFCAAEADPILQSWTSVVATETGITAATNLPMTRRPSSPSEPSHQASIDGIFLQDPIKFRVCLTISDLINITLIPPSESSVPKKAPMSPSAYCGPGTMFIDYAMRYTSSNRVDNDRDGNYGARGTVNQDIVDRFLSTHDYAVHTPPLSIAIEMFGQHEAQSLVDDCLYLGMSDTDTVATITRVTSENIVIQYRRLMKTFFPDQKDIEMFVCGEGAKNMNIIDHLEEALPEVLTKPLDDIGIPDCAKDSVRCAQLGLETILRHALSEGKAEAEEQKNMLGNIVKGNNWGNTQQQIVHFSGGMELPPVRRVIVEDEQ